MELTKQDAAALIHERADTIKWPPVVLTEPYFHGSLPTWYQVLMPKNSVLVHSAAKEKVNGKWSPKLNRANALVELPT